MWSQRNDLQKPAALAAKEQQRQKHMKEARHAPPFRWWTERNLPKAGEPFCKDGQSAAADDDDDKDAPFETARTSNGFPVYAGRLSLMSLVGGSASNRGELKDTTPIEINDIVIVKADRNDASASKYPFFYVGQVVGTAVQEKK